MTLIWALAAPFMTQLPDSASGKTVGRRPCTHMGNLQEGPSSWLLSGSTLAVVPIWRVNQQTENQSFSLSICLSNKSLKKNSVQISQCDLVASATSKDTTDSVKIRFCFYRIQTISLFISLNPHISPRGTTLISNGQMRLSNFPLHWQIFSPLDIYLSKYL